MPLTHPIYKVIYIGGKLNIFDHELVPKHEILNEEEVEALLSKYNITKENLPKILDKDPAVKLLGAKVGDVIKITRKSLTAGESVYYRVVISSTSVHAEEGEMIEQNISSSSETKEVSEDQEE